MIHTVHSLPGRTLYVDGTAFVYMSGTAYLGMPHLEAFQQCLQDAFARYGTHFSGSRISHMQLAVFEEAEAFLAQWTRAQAAVTLSSGFLAGQLVVRQLKHEGSLLYAPRTHPALHLDTPPVSRQSYAEWVNTLPQQLENIPGSCVVICSNSSDPLYAEPYSFDWIAELPTTRKFVVVIDDSHGLGLTGQEGSGIWSQLPQCAHVEAIVTSSLGKALGLPGGVVLGSRSRIDQLKKSPVFTSASPMPPAYLYAFLYAQKLYLQQRERLQENLDFFMQSLPNGHSFQWAVPYPVFYTPDTEVYTQLYQQGILVSHFSYPSPDDPPITRLIVHALLTKEDIKGLAASLLS